MKLFIFIFGILLNTLVSAEIYEIIDANGRKIYTDTPPLDKPDIKPVSVKPNTGNTWQLDDLQKENDDYFDKIEDEAKAENAIKEKEAADQEAKRQQAADAVIAAEKALEDAKEIEAGDYLPNSKNGIHYKPEYLERVKEAEEALEKAREEAQDQ